MTNRHDADVRKQLRERAVWQLKRVRFADEIPIAIEHAFYPPDIGLELDKRDLTSIVMYRVFESELGFDIKEATQTIGASLADATSARLLGVKAGSPLLSIERLTVNTDGRPLELLRSVYLPGLFPAQHQPDAASSLTPSLQVRRSVKKDHRPWQMVAKRKTPTS